MLEDILQWLVSIQGDKKRGFFINGKFLNVSRFFLTRFYVPTRESDVIYQFQR